jgi:crotonobetainyl-CoA:carnitine CoA-transferase CaiB-like acyl-CoA transferase
MPQLGFDFASMEKINPRIVHTSMPGYGSSGPGHNRVALGPVIEAAVGLTAMMGYRDSGPYRSGVAWADPVSGMAAAAGTLVGLWNRGASGRAQRVEAAMSESMATFAGDELLAAQARGSNAPRLGSRHRTFAPQGVYRCAGDDRWLAVSCTSDEEWQALCEVASLSPSLTSLDEPARRARHDEIDVAIGAWTRSRSPRQVMEQLQARGVIAAQVSDARDLVEDPQLEARAFWAQLDHPDVGFRRYPGNPIRLSETPVTYRFAAPGLGQHNDEVFGGMLGMSTAELSELRDAGVIVDQPPEAPAG